MKDEYLELQPIIIQYMSSFSGVYTQCKLTLTCRGMWSLTDSIDKQMMSVTLWIPVLYNGEFACIPLWPSNDFIHCLAIHLKFPTTCINPTSLDGIENTGIQTCFNCCYAPCWFLRPGTCIPILCIYVDNQTKCHRRHLKIQTETVWRRLSCLLVIFLLY